MLTSMVSFMMLQASDYSYLNSSTDIYTGLPSYVCNGTWVAGGFNKFGRGDVVNHTFTLPKHSKVIITINIMFGDSWDDYANNYLNISVDGTVVKRMTKGPYEGTYMCGNTGYQDKFIDFRWEGTHSSSTLMLTMINTLDENKDNGNHYQYLEWLGFTDVKIFYDDICYRFYSECNYQGTEYKMCSSYPSEDQQQFLTPIKSFLISLGNILYLQDPNYEGGNLIAYTTNQTCVGPYLFPKKTPRRDP